MDFTSPIDLSNLKGNSKGMVSFNDMLLKETILVTTSKRYKNFLVDYVSKDFTSARRDDFRDNPTLTDGELSTLKDVKTGFIDPKLVFNNFEQLKSKATKFGNGSAFKFALKDDTDNFGIIVVTDNNRDEFKQVKDKIKVTK